MEAQKQFVRKGQIQLSHDPFIGNSSYTADYLSKGVPVKSERVPQPQNKILPEGKFEGDSTYHNNYVPGKGEKGEKFKPQENLKIGGAFEGLSSYNYDYLNKGAPMRAEKVPLPQNEVMPKGRFEGDSTYTNNYIPGKI